MELAHFYHCWCGGGWRPIVEEHIQALVDGEFDGPLIIGVVGPPEARGKARRMFRAAFPDCEMLEADTGWEVLTLDALWAYAQHHDGAVFYAHTHGAWHPSDWHRDMQQKVADHLTRRWRAATRSLAEQPDHAIGWVDSNFWIARNEHLRPESYPMEAFSSVSEPRVLVEPAGWLAVAEHAAANLFLIDLLEGLLSRLAGDMFSWRSGSGRRLRPVVRDIPDGQLRAAVAATAASWPGWRLPGAETELTVDRLDAHFAPVQRMATSGRRSPSVQIIPPDWGSNA